LKKKIRKPLPDDQLAELLKKEKGTPLREEPSLNIGNNYIPVARMQEDIVLNHCQSSKL
jgi:hypothetical protein